MSEPASAGRWSGAVYADHADHHRALDDWFLDRLRPHPDSIVVDLGSGSGEFSARLAEIVTGGRVIGVEPDPSMLEAARRHAGPNLHFVRASAQEFDRVVDHGSVDLVLSRAMLHWLPLESYPRVFNAVHQVLRPGGWYHSESGGAGNVPNVVELLNDLAARFSLPAPPDFPDAGVVFDLLEQAGFEIPVEGVRTVAQRRSFSRDEMLGFLRPRRPWRSLGRRAGTWVKRSWRRLGYPRTIFSTSACCQSSGRRGTLRWSAIGDAAANRAPAAGRPSITR